jgi:hypothetical protein
MEKVNYGICKDSVAQLFATSESLVKEVQNSIVSGEFVGFLGALMSSVSTASVQFCHNIYKYVRSLSIVLIAFPATHDHI